MVQFQSQVAGDLEVSNEPETALAVDLEANVAANTLTTIVTFTTTAADKNITRISCSGDLYAKFQIFVDTVLTETLHSGPQRFVQFEFKNYGFTAGQVIDVKVEHGYTGKTPDYHSTIYGF